MQRLNVRSKASVWVCFSQKNKEAMKVQNGMPSFYGRTWGFRTRNSRIYAILLLTYCGAVSWHVSMMIDFRNTRTCVHAVHLHAYCSVLLGREFVVANMRGVLSVDAHVAIASGFIAVQVMLARRIWRMSRRYVYYIWVRYFPKSVDLTMRNTEHAYFFQNHLTHMWRIASLSNDCHRKILFDVFKLSSWMDAVFNVSSWSQGMQTRQRCIIGSRLNGEIFRTQSVACSRCVHTATPARNTTFHRLRMCLCAWCGSSTAVPGHQRHDMCMPGGCGCRCVGVAAVVWVWLPLRGCGCRCVGVATIAWWVWLPLRRCER